jgi:hypothetical protein
MLRVLVVLSQLGCVQDMKTTIEVVNNRFPTPLPASDGVVEGLLKDLDQNGIVLLPRLIPDEQLKSMQRAFESRLRRLRWNNFEGYEKTEPYRHMIEDVLLLDQGFLDLAIHPIVKALVKAYVGEKAELTEARGWRSLPTRRDFHGWHGDAWYDQETHREIPRELKLAVYLTDVRSGAFNYIRGSHRQDHPRPVPTAEIREILSYEVMEMMGNAGTVFMFDTSGVHRQGVPMLERRHAVFYNYHDPQIRLQKGDYEANRYHPLSLNAAFLGDLSPDDQKMLGFGNKTNFIPAYIRPAQPPFLYHAFMATLNLQLRARNLRERVVAKLNHVRGRK